MILNLTNLAFGWTARYSPLNPSVSGIFLKFTNFLSLFSLVWAQQYTLLIIICIEIASTTAFICSDKSKHTNSSSRWIDNKPFEGTSRHLAEYNVV